MHLNTKSRFTFSVYIFNEFTTWLSRSLGLYLKFETRRSSNGFRSLFYIDREKIKSRALAKRQLFNLCSNWSRLRDKSNNRCCKCSSINDERMRADALKGATPKIRCIFSSSLDKDEMWVWREIQLHSCLLDLGVILLFLISIH